MIQEKNNRKEYKINLIACIENIESYIYIQIKQLFILNNMVSFKID